MGYFNYLNSDSSRALREATSGGSLRIACLREKKNKLDYDKGFCAMWCLNIFLNNHRFDITRYISYNICIPIWSQLCHHPHPIYSCQFIWL